MRKVYLLKKQLFEIIYRIGSGTIKAMAVGGAILIGLYSWSINSYPLPVDSCQGWEYYNALLLLCESIELESTPTSLLHFYSIGYKQAAESSLIRCWLAAAFLLFYSRSSRSISNNQRHFSDSCNIVFFGYIFCLILFIQAVLSPFFIWNTLNWVPKAVEKKESWIWAYKKSTGIVHKYCCLELLYSSFLSKYI